MPDTLACVSCLCRQRLLSPATYKLFVKNWSKAWTVIGAIEGASVAERGGPRTFCLRQDLSFQEAQGGDLVPGRPRTLSRSLLLLPPAWLLLSLCLLWLPLCSARPSSALSAAA